MLERRCVHAVESKVERVEGGKTCGKYAYIYIYVCVCAQGYTSTYI